MPEPTLSFSAQSIAILLAVAAAIVLAGFSYRHSIPPLPNRLKIFLASIRALALVFLILLIAEPILSLLFRAEQQPLVAILADDSRSMTIEDGGTTRASRQQSVLASQELRTIGDEASIVFGAFSNRLRLFTSLASDSLVYTGARTNIEAALDDLKKKTVDRNLRAIVLLSDGNLTAGTNPLLEVEELDVPIFTIGIGDTLEQRDVLIRKVVTNNIAYVGSRVPVHVTLRQTGYGGRQSEITLSEGGKVFDRRFVKLNEGQSEYLVPMSFTPSEEGTHRYTAEVSQFPGEVSGQNNRSTFYTKVLKSKMKVVLIAGGPSADYTFVKRALESDGNIELSSFIERRDGSFDQGAAAANRVRDAECIVLIGFPTRASQPDLISALVENVRRGKGLFLLFSRTLDGEKLKSLEMQLPMAFDRVLPDELTARILVPEHQRNNPLIRLRSGSDNLLVWADLPPIFVRQMVGRVKPDADIVGVKRIQGILTAEPMIVTRSTPQQRMILFLGYGVWRWKMMTGEIPGGPGVLEHFLSQSMRWLTARADNRPVRIAPVTEVFVGGDPVEFTGQVYDSNMHPLEDAEVRVQITGNDQRYDVSLSPLGEGQYEGRIDGLFPGDYRFTATAVVHGLSVGEDAGTFSIGGAEAEFVETRMNKELLQQIAYRSGGIYYDAENIDSLAKDIRNAPGFLPRSQLTALKYSLWNEPWPYAVILLLLTVEWTLRKRSGMI